MKIQKPSQIHCCKENFQVHAPHLWLFQLQNPLTSTVATQLHPPHPHAHQEVSHLAAAVAQLSSAWGGS